ncbi:hypothetical protein J4050_09275 [Winogradskyella sp. DF17]|uniref:Sugar transporter n=1 Tax=Winogradskyella pelagia TaxID=2819984 RepID=A0ABS3T2G4_9FLAO|nr:hypothetical protein [Winogradskyella sp. DF17]MBO3116938.1 hypothetical protein [Winogradskyella sp. DF17]
MTTKKPPIWYWIVGVVALIWNAMGVNAYLQQAYNTESYRAMYSKEQLEIAANLPSFVTAAFALAVFGGALASLLLLFRKKLAVMLFYVSLIAVVIQMGYLLINGYASSIPMTIMIILFAVVLAWFSKYSATKGYLN